MSASRPRRGHGPRSAHSSLDDGAKGTPFGTLRPRPQAPEGRARAGTRVPILCARRDKTKIMTFTDAAAEVLRLVGRPLHYKEITDIAIEKNLLSHVGKSPEVTMGARLAAMLKKDSPENPLIRVKPGVFALRDWDEKTIKAGLDGKKQRRGKVDEERPREEDEAEEPAVLDAGPEEPVDAPAEVEEAAPEEPLAFEEEDDLAEPEEDAPAEPELAGPTVAQQWGLRAEQPAYA